MAINCIKADFQSLEQMQSALNPYPHLAGGISTFGVAHMLFKKKYKEIYGIEPHVAAIKSDNSYQYGSVHLKWMEIYTDGSHDSQRFKMIWNTPTEVCPKQTCFCKYEHYLEFAGPY